MFPELKESAQELQEGRNYLFKWQNFGVSIDFYPLIV